MRRRRGRSIVAALLVAALTAGCATPSQDAAAAAPVATGRCASPEFPALQAGLHLIGDREPPVAYSSTPPTSGWHRSGVARPGVHAEPLDESLQVGLLEEGRVVVTHGRIDDAAAAGLAALAEETDGRVAVTPYPALDDGTVVAAAWGVLQRCDGVDADALRRFVAFYADREGLEGVHGQR